MHVALFGFMHELGHLFHQREQIERLLRELDGATVELTNVAQLGHDRHQPRTRLLRLVDHPALPLAHRRFLIFLQHPQVTADDAGWSPEFVNGERNERRVWRV